MSDIETSLRVLAKSGRLNHVSVAFVDGTWSASYRGVEDRDKRFVTHSDPASAMLMALTGRKIDEPKVAQAPKRRRAAPTPPPTEDDDEDLL